MTSKGAKETIVSKLGFKSSSSSSKVEAELDRMKKENAHLKKKIDELAKRHIRPPDSDKSKLLERILSLETLRERNNQQLLVKEQELETLRQQLTARGGEVVASLQAQLEQRRKEAEQRDALFQSVSQETENLKNKLASVSAHCQSLETQLAPPAEVALVQEQLKDALEKNQQWLVYDQQREAYVQSVLARTRELEQQLAKQQQATQIAMSSLQRKYEVKNRELGEAREELQGEKLRNRYTIYCNISFLLFNRDATLHHNNFPQVNMLQKSLLSQKEEQVRIAALEQQIQLSAKEFENEKIDRQSMQHQLHKVLKELRKARDQIAKLESAKPCNARFSEPSSCNRFERLTIDDPVGPTSPSKVTCLLDESFLECPKCHTPYPTSRHRELLAHIDYCMA
uniref:TSG101 and ALIX binding domain-containing protein n=1 Tax=Periophthalmus magnuspinnatus TaxID=409849 RepID=A0A3B4AWL3_9GOBI